MKKSFALYCPHCQKYGVAVTLHLGTSKEVLFHCPACGSIITLEQIRALMTNGGTRERGNDR